MFDTAQNGPPPDAREVHFWYNGIDHYKFAPLKSANGIEQSLVEAPKPPQRLLAAGQLRLPCDTNNAARLPPQQPHASSVGDHAAPTAAPQWSQQPWQQKRQRQQQRQTSASGAAQPAARQLGAGGRATGADASRQPLPSHWQREVCLCRGMHVAASMPVVGEVHRLVTQFTGPL